MDRLDAMAVFLAALDEGSLAGAGRRLGRSPAAVTRAVAFLEAHVGAILLRRTTRAMHPTEAGERYAAVCRRVLADLEEAELQAAGDRSAPRGLLTVTAPVAFGTRVLRPIAGAFLAAHPAVRLALLLLDRPVDLIEEGVDAAVRIAHLPDSALVAIRVGQVRRVLCAAPSYLARSPPILRPADLARHDCIATGQSETWSFRSAPGASDLRGVRVSPRLSVNAVAAAVAACADGEGLARLLSYQVEAEARDGRLALLLPEYEPDPLPIHVITPEGRLATAKVRAFVDFAVPRLRDALSHFDCTPSSGMR